MNPNLFVFRYYIDMERLLMGEWYSPQQTDNKELKLDLTDMSDLLATIVTTLNVIKSA